MLSCDTFVLGGSRTENGRRLLAKNSDRPLGECQPLRYFKAEDHGEGEQLHTTNLVIPQVRHTYALVGCQPYWIWGFEMGVNEKGLCIGNEAEGSRCDGEKEEGLLGMDLLRLALERSADCKEAINVITGLLKQYGQNANANPLYDRRYENTFILSDRKEAWILETAGRTWAARQAGDMYAVSNCYTIGSDYDLCADDMEQIVRDNRFLRPGEIIDFAKAFTKPASRQTNSVPRKRRMEKLLGNEGKVTEADIKHVLRDHFEGELIEPRYGAMNANFVSICMHAQTWDAAQTAASLICTELPGIGTKMLYAASVPCCSVYIPVYWTDGAACVLPEVLSAGEGTYSKESLWWRCEYLSALVSVDEERFGLFVRDALRRTEKHILAKTIECENKVKSYFENGAAEYGRSLLNDLTKESTELVYDVTGTLAGMVRDEIAGDGGLYGIRKEMLEDYFHRVKFPAFGE